MEAHHKTHTVPGKYWEIFSFWVFKEMSVQDTFMATHDKEYRLYKISSEKLLDKLQQAATTNPGMQEGMEKLIFRVTTL